MQRGDLMSDQKKDHSLLVSFDDQSQLHQDLNRGIAALAQAKESCFRPHLCLNEQDGLEVIRRIAQDPDQARTHVFITNSPILSLTDGLWLNIGLGVFLDKLSSKSMVRLSPRQTGYVVANLPEESSSIVLTKVREWYQGYFLEKLQQALVVVTRQIDMGDLLIAGTHTNRVFDIHDNAGGHSDTPYTEWSLVGDELFIRLFHGPTLLQHGQNGFDRIDAILESMDTQRAQVADGMFNALRMLVGASSGG